jgi:ABC-type antimicrobial peptide transport system permease subunit
MEEILAESTGRASLNMVALTAFSCSALLLAAIGVYGLMAFSVRQRTQELGVRLALGATPAQVRNAVVREGMVPAATGVAAGFGIAFGLSRLLASALFGVKPHDPLVFGAIPIVLALVAIIAAWLPACRATRIDPAVALRCE